MKFKLAELIFLTKLADEDLARRFAKVNERNKRVIQNLRKALNVKFINENQLFKDESENPMENFLKFSLRNAGAGSINLAKADENLLKLYAANPKLAKLGKRNLVFFANALMSREPTTMAKYLLPGYENAIFAKTHIPEEEMAELRPKLLRYLASKLATHELFELSMAKKRGVKFTPEGDYIQFSHVVPQIPLMNKRLDRELAEKGIPTAEDFLRGLTGEGQTLKIPMSKWKRIVKLMSTPKGTYNAKLVPLMLTGKYGIIPITSKGKRVAERLTTQPEFKEYFEKAGPQDIKQLAKMRRLVRENIGKFVSGKISLEEYLRKVIFNDSPMADEIVKMIKNIK